MEKIIWAGFSIALFAAILTVTKRQSGVSDKLLSAWLFLFAFDYANLGITAMATDYYLIPSSFFLFNPAFFLYARSLTDTHFALKWRQLLHLLPYVFFELAKWFFPFSLNLEQFFNPDKELWLRLLYGISMIASLSIYNIMSILMVHRHRINLKHIFSNISENQRITWLLIVLISYMLYVFTVVVWGLFGLIFKDLDAATTYNYLASWMLIFMLGFYGINQEEIFKKRKTNNDNENGDDRYKLSGLTDKRKNEIKKLILNYFTKSEPYLNSELSMPMLSEALQIPKYQLTEVLNTEIGKNFFQFVNEFRVQAVKNKLEDPKNDELSIEAIGYDCGFSSKSSFFAVFKLISGNTPLQYRKSVRNI